MSSISYAITVCNELEELESLINNIISHVRDEDELVILFDAQNGSKEVEKYLGDLDNSLKYENILYNIIKYPLQDDFASFKNHLKNQCIKEWIFFIDADETCDENLLINLSIVLNINQDVDVISVPRVNYVKNITLEDITQWGWRVDEKNRINYPDMQMRIMQNKPDIKWVNKVHEVLSGYKSISHLPFNVDGWGLIHDKTIEKQRKQNQFYENLKPK